MTIHVRLDADSIAVEIADNAESLVDWNARFAAPYNQWVAGDGSTELGQFYNGATFEDVVIPLADYKASAFQGVNSSCQQRILAEWPIEKQVSFANGIYTNSAQKLQYQEDTMATIEASNVAQDAIAAATNNAEVDAAMAGVIWPVYPV